ncbi:MAG: serine hydrolase [Parachlamydiales bacterium]|jgi:CubicO group peptidase (beta-lactamase class C family)
MGLTRFCLLAISLSLFGATLLHGDELSDLDHYIEKVRMEKQVPGIAVAIVKGDKVIFAKGYGIRKLGFEGNVDEDTIFQLASVSKTFTAAGIGVQVDKGKLTWDEEVIRHLSPFALKEAYASRYANARDLLSHRTGLPAFGGDLLGKLGYSSEEILYRVRFIEPATSFRNISFYSNVGFFIAGELLAKLAEKPYQEAIKSTLLVPLKLERTGFADRLQDSNTAYSHAIIHDKVQVVPWDNIRGFDAAGGITSTARDMGRWIAVHLNGGKVGESRILKADTVKEILSPSMVTEVSFTDLPPINDDSGLTYGLGWNNYHYKGKMIVEKGGALDGVRTVVTLIPEEKLGIVVLANLNLTVAPEAIRGKFLETYLGKSSQDLEKEMKAREEMIQQLVSGPAKKGKQLPIGHSLDLYTGQYSNELYGNFTVVNQDGKLSIDAGPAKWKGKLTSWSNDTFVITWPLINSGHEQLTFTFGPEGYATQIYFENLGTFQRVESNKD